MLGAERKGKYKQGTDDPHRLTDEPHQGGSWIESGVYSYCPVWATVLYSQTSYTGNIRAGGPKLPPAMTNDNMCGTTVVARDTPYIVPPQ